MAFGKKSCCEGCAREPSKARISGNPIAHLFQMGGEVMKELESTDPLFIHEDEGYNTAVLSDMLRRDVEFNPYDDTYSREGSIEYWRALLEDGVIDKERYLAELARVPPPDAEEQARIDRMVEADARLPGNELGGTPLELYVEEVTGMEPGLDRATFLPFAGSREEGNLEFAAPALVYEAAMALNAPGVALRGEEITPEEVFNTAGLLTAGSFGASGIRRGSLPPEAGVFETGMASIPPGGINFNRFPLKKSYKDPDIRQPGSWFSDKPTSYDPQGTWGSVVSTAELGAQAQAKKLSTVDKYVYEVRSEFEKQGYEANEYGPALYKLQNWLEKDYLTANDPLRGALYRGEIPASSMASASIGETTYGRMSKRLEEILNDPLEASVLAHDEKLRRPLYKKLQKNQPLSVEEQIIWDNPPPIRIEAERLYDEMGQAKAYRLYPTETAENIESIFPYRQQEFPSEPVAEALSNYPTSASQVLDEDWIDSDTGLLEKNYAATELGLARGEPDPLLEALRKTPETPVGMTIGEGHLNAQRDVDSTFARALEEQETVFVPGGLEYTSIQAPFLEPDTMVEYLTAGVEPEDLADLATRSSFVDRYASGARLLDKSREYDVLIDRINTAVRNVGNTLRNTGTNDYAEVDALIPEGTWRKGTNTVLDTPPTNSYWAQVADTELLHLYGEYMSHSIGGYSVKGKEPDYPAWGKYKGPGAVDAGAVEIYALHDKTTEAPRLTVQVFRNINSEMDKNTALSPDLRHVRRENLPEGAALITQVKGRRGPAHEKRTDRPYYGGNRPPHSRDIEGLFALFNQLDVDPDNVSWDEFTETINLAPVNDPLRRSYVRYVDEVNDEELLSQGIGVDGMGVDALEDILSTYDRDMFLQRQDAYDDGPGLTPAELPWIVQTDGLEVSIKDFLRDIYTEYRLGANDSAYETIRLEELAEAAAQPQPHVTEW